MAKFTINPQWVYQTSDKKRAMLHVSKFRDIQPRPAVNCPECHAPVILALGEKNTDHYRHQKNSHCSLKGARESIMHSNVKFHIRNELANGEKLIIRRRCQEQPNTQCKSTSDKVIFSHWETATVEYQVDKYLADIAVIKKQTTIGVIEVWVTHQTTGEKASYLSKNIPWLEVMVTDENYHDIMNWDISQAFPLELSFSTLPTYKCAQCISFNTKKNLHDKEITRFERLPANIKCIGVRDIDLIFKSGKTFRKYLYLYADYRGSKIKETWLQFKGESKKMYPLSQPSNNHHIKNYYRKTLNENFQMIEMTILQYSKHAISYHIHNPRHETDAESPSLNLLTQHPSDKNRKA